MIAVAFRTLLTLASLWAVFIAGPANAGGPTGVDISYTCQLNEFFQAVEVNGTVTDGNSTAMPPNCGFRLQLEQQGRGPWQNLGGDVVPTIDGNAFSAELPVCTPDFSASARVVKAVAEFDYLVSGESCADPNRVIKTVTGTCTPHRDARIQLPPGLCEQT